MMVIACQFTSSQLNTHRIISRQLHCRAVQEISIMKNMEMKREGSKLIIEVDLTKDFGISKSGKSVIIASSEGNIGLPDDDEIKIGLNIYRKA